METQGFHPRMHALSQFLSQAPRTIIAEWLIFNNSNLVVWVFGLEVGIPSEISKPK